MRRSRRGFTNRYVLQCQWRHVEISWGDAMSTGTHVQTMDLTFQAICQGERPWVALGNLQNAWFDYARKQRAYLVADPLVLPESPDLHTLRWAAFCASSVECLCLQYGVPCPSWVHHGAYALCEPWYDSPSADILHVRERLRQQTPEPFTRRNIFCGNRMLPPPQHLYSPESLFPFPVLR
jgi:hypothetical protein